MLTRLVVVYGFMQAKTCGTNFKDLVRVFDVIAYLILYDSSGPQKTDWWVRQEVNVQNVQRRR